MRPLIGVRCERRADRRQDPVLCRIDARRVDAGSLADGLAARRPCRRGRPGPSPRSDDPPLRTRGTRRCRTDGSRRPRRQSSAAYSSRHSRVGTTGPAARPSGSSSMPMPTGSAGNISPTQRDRGLAAATAARRLHRTRLGLGARVAQHRAGEHVLGFGMRRHAESGHVDADDAHAVDRLRQQLQRHAGGGGHAQVVMIDRVVQLGIGQLEHGLADVLEQLAGDQRLGIERHVADRAARAVEVRGEGQAVHAARGAGQDRRRAAHAQADAQRAERRAHALRLVVRSDAGSRARTLERLALACRGRSALHLVLARVATAPGDARRLAGRQVGGLGVGNAGVSRDDAHCWMPLQTAS